MAIYFYERGLRYEDGKIALIPYRQILEECLKEPFETISISSLIFAAINKISGMKVIKRNYSKSLLYKWLERRICQDSKYKQAKEIKIRERQETRIFEKEYKERMKNSKGFNTQLEYIAKQRAKLKMNSRRRTEW